MVGVLPEGAAMSKATERAREILSTGAASHKDAERKRQVPFAALDYIEALEAYHNVVTTGTAATLHFAKRKFEEAVK